MKSSSGSSGLVALAPYNSRLHGFAVIVAAATFLLLGAGGLVTSHGVGMAVPDWPNTYGYNLFFFPVSKWIGGIFYEHTHRLIASGVGILTAILALWLYGKSARRLMRWLGLGLLVLGNASVVLFSTRWTDGLVEAATGLALFGSSFVWPRCEASPRWQRRLGFLAFLAVVAQGVLGGLRVILYEAQIGIFHAALAQLFFVLLCAIALFTSKWWGTLTPALSRETGEGEPLQRSTLGFQPTPTLTPTLSSGTGEGDESQPSTFNLQSTLRYLFIATTGLILLQLVLGAMMRHQHAGLAIPDFPLAYGKLWPATDPQSVARYNERRIEVTAANPITAFQIELQMAHRMLAVLILVGVGFCAVQTRRLRVGAQHPAGRIVARLAWAWLGLVLVQVALGAFTILSNKAADVATAHVLTGALTLAVGALLSIISLQFESHAVQSPAASGTGEQAKHGLAGHPAPAHL